MPGNTRCLKCGGRLGLAGAEIAIEPPRASAGTKRLRRWLPRWTQAVHAGRMRDAVGRGTDRLNLPRLPAGCFPRMIVPGWGQWYLGNAARARNYFIPWLTLVVLSSFRWHTVLGSVALYAALCIHAISIADLVCRPAREVK
jgi:hypothetical protein